VYAKDKVSNYEFKWLTTSFGTNARITEMQAAIGRVQLKYIDIWHNKRVSNMNKILGTAKKCKGLRVPEIPHYMDHAAYKCYVFVNVSDLTPSWDRGRVVRKINELGVPCFTGSCPEVYLEKSFDNTSFRPLQRMPNAKKLGETSLMFLVHPTLTDNEINKTCSVIMQVMKMATLPLKKD